ncbi:hypothetical protein ROA7450_04195 [Roseovarius albus]|uniref:Uncharacterized protein n=1 Tax=Roseovarius albus TaxID=1247867 RepID=A0A1X7ACA0_9RHOB|nr:hypothetical protein [Roseovarius albus]SLN74059.1 hypothetical protein ROA7450_04195 [Roseovarius albus]
MLTISINYHFNCRDYPLLKEAAALYFPGIAPTHRLELISRWCGFTTLASLRNALRRVAESDIYLTIDPIKARTFADDRGISFDALACHQTLASVAFAKVAREYPYLHGDGYGQHSTYVLDREQKEIRKGVSAIEGSRRIFELREKRLVESREELLTVRKNDEFIRALALCSALKPIRNINRKQTSYNLKHRAEERNYFLAEGVTLTRQYVSNSALIAAAFYAGFETDADKRNNYPSSPNIYFNVSQRSLNEVIENAPKEYA